MNSLEWFCVLSGFAIGSFIATAFDRSQTKGRILAGASKCDQCDTRLAWHNLIPVVSFLAQSSRCRTCRSPISLKYPLTELLGGGAGLAAALYAPDEAVLVSCLFGWLLLAIGLTDWFTYRIPDILTLSVAILGLITVCLMFPFSWQDHLIGGAIAYLSFRMIEVLYLSLKGRAGMGRGDTKLFGALGLWIGWSGLAPALLIASSLALLHGLGQSLSRNRGLTSTHMVPFGPWLSLAGYVVWLWQINPFA